MVSDFQHVRQRTKSKWHRAKIGFHHRIHDPSRKQALAKTRAPNEILLSMRTPFEVNSGDSSSDRVSNAYPTISTAAEEYGLDTSGASYYQQPEEFQVVEPSEKDKTNIGDKEGVTASNSIGQSGSSKSITQSNQSESANQSNQSTQSTKSDPVTQAEESSNESASAVGESKTTVTSELSVSIQKIKPKDQHRISQLFEHLRSNHASSRTCAAAPSQSVEGEFSGAKYKKREGLAHRTKADNVVKNAQHEVAFQQDTKTPPNKRSRRSWKSLNRRISLNAALISMGKTPEGQDNHGVKENSSKITVQSSDQVIENDGSDATNYPEASHNRGGDASEDIFQDFSQISPAASIPSIVVNGSSESKIGGSAETFETFKSCLVSDEDSPLLHPDPSRPKKAVTISPEDPDVRSISIYSYLYDDDIQLPYDPYSLADDEKEQEDEEDQVSGQVQSDPPKKEGSLIRRLGATFNRRRHSDESEKSEKSTNSLRAALKRKAGSVGPNFQPTTRTHIIPIGPHCRHTDDSFLTRRTPERQAEAEARTEALIWAEVDLDINSQEIQIEPESKYHSRPHNDETRAEAFRTLKEENLEHRRMLIEEFTPHYHPYSKEGIFSEIKCCYHKPMRMSEKKDPGFEYLEKILPVRPWNCHEDEIEKYGIYVDIRTATKYYEGEPTSILELRAMQSKVADAVDALYEQERRRSGVPLNRIYEDENDEEKLEHLIEEYDFGVRTIEERVKNGEMVFSMIREGIDISAIEAIAHKFDEATQILICKIKCNILDDDIFEEEEVKEETPVELTEDQKAKQEKAFAKFMRILDGHFNDDEEEDEEVITNKNVEQNRQTFDEQENDAIADFYGDYYEDTIDGETLVEDNSELAHNSSGKYELAMKENRFEITDISKRNNENILTESSQMSPVAISKKPQGFSPVSKAAATSSLRISHSKYYL